jgi:hypothetical protein
VEAEFMMPMKPSTEEYATALHEAAHAIIALELGVPVEYATIEPCGNTIGHVKHGEATAEQEAIIAMAGPMADTKFAGIDYEMAARLGPFTVRSAQVQSENEMWVQTWVHISVLGGISEMPINRLSQRKVTNA